MDRNHAFKLVVILGVLALCLFKLYPTYQYFSKYRSLTAEEVENLSEGERRRMQSVALRQWPRPSLPGEPARRGRATDVSHKRCGL